MGTNFYTMNGVHIGKRSAAGPYCWDCKTTLCKTGDNGVHKSDSEWHSACPGCGQFMATPDLNSGAAAVELGFAKPYKSKERHGVKSCSSFSWGIHPLKVSDCKIIKDEYGKKYTIKQFKKMVLENCPIQFYDYIGVEFS